MVYKLGWEEQPGTSKGEHQGNIEEYVGHDKKDLRELIYLPSDIVSQFSPAIAILLNPERCKGVNAPT